jgi:transposase
MKKLTITKFKPEEIKALITSDKKLRLGIKLLVCYNVSLGKVSRELEELFDVSFKTICNWVNNFNNYGLNGLLDKPGRGKKQRISEKQLSEIKEIILNKIPEDYNYKSGTWTGAILINLIEKKYHIKYKKSNIYKILHKKLGLSYQRGKGFYLEADPEKRREFEKDFKKNFRL